MHCQEQMIEDVKYGGWPEYLLNWANDEYSTSKHLLVIRSICEGLNAKHVGEIGFGRSTFALTAREGVWVCDRYPYWTLFDCWTTRDHFFQSVNKFYKEAPGFDFLFLDYFSSRDYDEGFCYHEIKRGFRHLRKNGFVAIHDTLEGKYEVSKAIKHLKKKLGNDAEFITFPYCFGMTLIRRLSDSPYGTCSPVSRKKKDERTVS